MKKLLICLILMSAIIIPLACGNQNNAPSSPIGSNGGPTSTRTPTPGGNTSTPTPGGNTPTFTPTFALAAPVVQHNFGTTSAPNGMIISSGLLTVAENDSTYGPMVENFAIAGAANGTVNQPPGQANYVLQGFPTPGSTPGWAPISIALAGPQGFVNPGGNGGYASVLDTQSNGNAILYYGNSSMTGWGAPYSYDFIYEPFNVSGFNSGTFKSPEGMSADGSGNVYIADTGNGVIEQFNALGPQHAWPGNAGISIPNAGGIAFTSVLFKTPYAVACDSNSPATVYVGDNGYNPAVIQSFSSGGTTIVGGFQTVAGCVVHGIAIGPSPNYYVYVADSFNGQIEVYSTTGNLLTVIKDPHAAWEGNGTFSPSCIGFDANGYIWVGDSINRQIVSFH